MGWFGFQWYGGSGSGGSSSPVFPNLTNATTADAIRDRIVTVVEKLTPTYLSRDLFRRYLNEGDGDFIKWAETNPAGALRRFQVRFDGHDQEPEVSNSDYEERLATFTIIIAYPQTARAGSKQALDRDTAIDRDQDALEKAVGLYGRSNFSGSFPDGVVTAWDATRVKGSGCDYLEITTTYRFIRQLF